MDVRYSDRFRRWLSGLKDIRAAARIQIRIDRIERGLLGDVKRFSGIGEIRIDYGPGYRLYFVERGDTVVVLLCGGDKSSQQRDIRIALEMAKEF